MSKQHSPGFLALVRAAKAQVREYTVDDVRDRQLNRNSFVLLDVREESEWHRGHIAGAVHLSKGILERDIETLYPEKDTDLVLYCGGGFRSALAAEALQKMGYTNVSSMDGGWRGWTAAGFPTEVPD
ncbi:rhodanese-like domain-containing protein [Synechococcus sp. PCC 7336]|uniref:rhodanese-like domain-containing protein n=1 Tax=Synechococcus sp. PCC 7336 TaxID=195250 RepID=UPI00034678BB|nr:rhodanese-like domain-containing protein [Synechococcus sp. PCC 7336]